MSCHAWLALVWQGSGGGHTGRIRQAVVVTPSWPKPTPTLVIVCLGLGPIVGPIVVGVQAIRWLLPMARGMMTGLAARCALLHDYRR